MPKNVTITEAARILGVSRRTVYRQIETGELHSIQVGNARRVVLDTASINPTVTSDTDTENAQLRAQLAAVTAELEATRQDRDRWHEHARQLGTTVDRLAVTNAQLRGTVVDQQALGTGQDTPGAPRPVQRPWWRFWAR